MKKGSAVNAWLPEALEETMVQKLTPWRDSGLWLAFIMRGDVDHFGSSMKDTEPKPFFDVYCRRALHVAEATGFHCRWLRAKDLAHLAFCSDNWRYSHRAKGEMQRLRASEFSVYPRWFLSFLIANKKLTRA